MSGKRMIRADLRVAWWFLRQLRAWRGQKLAGHVFVVVDLKPGRPADVRARRLVQGGHGARTVPAERSAA